MQTGSTFTLVLDSQQLQDFHSATFTVEYDPKVLQLKELRQGSLLSASGKNFGLETKPKAADGEAQVNITLPAGEAGVTANGSLAVLQFEAVGAGNANVLISDLSPRNSRGQAIIKVSPAANIRVQ
ncbi:MAG: cohesin domain-containing protein [Bryobacterales bacterium]|nr:cohesin domain-containing protein [Bryobacterales bacterium]